MGKDKRRSIHNYQGSTLFIFVSLCAPYQIPTVEFHGWKAWLDPRSPLNRSHASWLGSYAGSCPQYIVVQGSSAAAAPTPRFFKRHAQVRAFLLPTDYTLRGLPSSLQISNGHQITFCIFSHFDSLSRCCSFICNVLFHSIKFQNPLLVSTLRQERGCSKAERLHELTQPGSTVRRTKVVQCSWKGRREFPAGGAGEGNLQRVPHFLQRAPPPHLFYLYLPHTQQEHMKLIKVSMASLYSF